MDTAQQQRSGFAFLSVITVGFLLTMLAAHPAELPKPKAQGMCWASDFSS